MALPLAAAVFICWSRSVYFEGLCNKCFQIAIGTVAEMTPTKEEGIHALLFSVLTNS